jgi:Tol biopolymer transport system component
LDWWLVALDSGAASPTGAVEHLARQKLTLPVPGQWLSGRVLFTADSGDSSNLWEASLTDPFRMSGPARRLTSSSGIDVAPFSAGGRTVFASLTENVDIWDLSIDADTAKITGELRRLTHDLAPDIGAVVSGDGNKVAYSSRRAGTFVLLLLDLSTGKETTLVSLPPSRVNTLLNLVPGITVDGEQVAYSFVENGAEAAAVMTATGGGARTVCSPCQFRSWGYVGQRVIVSEYGPQSLTGALDIAGGELQPLLPAGTYPNAPKTSWDDRWLTFYIPKAGKTRVWIAPIRSGSPPTESEMIPITDGSTWDSNPNFSPNGSLLYFYSQRDGARCIWAQRLDPRSKRPVGAAFAVYHLHSARRSPAYARVGQAGMSVARNRIVFVMPERLGNVWLVE